MKKTIKGSILIWSIFLSLFISFSFIIISNQIGDSIIKNKETIKGFSDYSSQEDKNLVFNDSFSGTLRQLETLKFSFTQNNTGTLTILNGGPVFFKIYSGSTIYNSGLVINSTGGLVLSGNLSLENLGGLTNFYLNFSGSTGINFPYNIYKIQKEIGGTSIQETGFIK